MPTLPVPNVASGLFPRARRTLGKPLVLGALTAVAGLTVALPWIVAMTTGAPYLNWLIGIDAEIYFSATRSWLQDGQWYLPRQLTGPYGIEYGDVLYPPTLLYLLLPFQWLPFALWWAIPVGAITVGLVIMRPPRWSWFLVPARQSRVVSVGWRP